MTAMDDFLHSVQKQAFVQARIATGNVDEALDILQDSMIGLVEKYHASANEEWPLLFQRILQNRIRDWYRRQKVRSILFWWQQHDNDDFECEQIFIEAKDLSPAYGYEPAQVYENAQVNLTINQALHNLPLRQQQAFLLRAWWEYSTKESSEIMGCSEGSVKTHYSRATKTLKQQLMPKSLLALTPKS